MSSPLEQEGGEPGADAPSRQRVQPLDEMLYSERQPPQEGAGHRRICAPGRIEVLFAQIEAGGSGHGDGRGRVTPRSEKRRFAQRAPGTFAMNDVDPPVPPAQDPDLSLENQVDPVGRLPRTKDRRARWIPAGAEPPAQVAPGRRCAVGEETVEGVSQWICASAPRPRAIISWCTRW